MSRTYSMNRIGNSLVGGGRRRKSAKTRKGASCGGTKKPFWRCWQSDESWEADQATAEWKRRDDIGMDMWHELVKWARGKKS